MKSEALKVNCRFCGGPASVLIENARDVVCGVGPQVDYFRCVDCRTVYHDTPVDYETWYANYYTHKLDIPNPSQVLLGKVLLGVGKIARTLTQSAQYKSGRWARYFETTIRSLTKSKADCIIDIGCGNGSYLLLMKSLGFTKLVGFDLDTKLLANESEFAGVELVDNFSFLLTEHREAADLVTIFHVLEHVEDPFSFLRDCLSLLKKNGSLILQVPNPESRQLAEFGDCWRGLEAPRHLQLLSKVVLSDWASQLNFEMSLLPDTKATASMRRKSLTLLKKNMPEAEVAIGGADYLDDFPDSRAYLTLVFWRNQDR